jgi:cobalt-zinc-cadmium efflux system membrane fusion protein
MDSVKSSQAVAALLGILVLLLPTIGFAHGAGHDHAPKAEEDLPSIPPPPPGEPIFLSKEAQFLLGVRTEPVNRAHIEASVSVPGKVVPRQDRQAHVFAPFAGRIRAPAVRLPLVGETVKRGQLLAILEQSLTAPEATQFLAEGIKAESEVQKAQSALELARRELARLASLSGVVAAKEVQRAEAAVKSAEQDVERARREVGLFDLAAKRARGGRLTEFPIHSPLSGVLVEAHAATGEQVDPSRALFTVLDPSVVWVAANVFAGDVAKVESTRAARIRTDAYPDRSFEASLFNLSQVVDEATRTVKVLFEVQNPDGRLRPGAFVEVFIGVGAEEALVIPASALVEFEGKAVVYVHTTPEAFVARPVEVGSREGTHVAVKGVREGDRVVTAGTYSLGAGRGRR